MITAAHTLLESLGLVLAKGNTTRYPATQIGPAENYRFWATSVRGHLEFGPQAKAGLSFDQMALRHLKYFGFRSRPNGREAVVDLPSDVESAVTVARIAMAALKAALEP